MLGSSSLKEMSYFLLLTELIPYLSFIALVLSLLLSYEIQFLISNAKVLNLPEREAHVYLTLHDPTNCSLPGSSVYGIFQARITGVGCHFLLQGILPTQGPNLHFLHLLHWHIGSPIIYHCATWEAS